MSGEIRGEPAVTIDAAHCSYCGWEVPGVIRDDGEYSPFPAVVFVSDLTEMFSRPCLSCLRPQIVASTQPAERRVRADE